MNQSERRDRIVEYLRVKPINHGQVYTFQIAIPDSEIQELLPERHEEISRSFREQGTNLIPLIVRRTEADDEDIDYEVVYGIDWLIVAQDLDIEKLWVWVFDMTDEEAAATKVQMNQLIGDQPLFSAPLPTVKDTIQPQIGATQELQTLINSALESTLKTLLASERQIWENKILAGHQENKALLEKILDRLPAKPEKININQATSAELQALGITTRAANAIVKSVKDNGPFKSISEISKRKIGVGPATIKQFPANLVCE